jgi:indolepyruvate ferredoxin oxidoreductase alpha subunit
MSDQKNIGTPILDTPLLLSANQALARGAIESGVAYVTGYPGTPSTDAIEALLTVPDLGFKVEWSINEKVAFEVATGVSWAGLRSMVTMKMSGLNVASDALVSVQYSGTNGGMVIYVADDPNTYYGMVEQDSRHYARLAVAPMLTPSSPQEALDFLRRAFDLSEEIRRPVMILMTTVLANTSEMVTLGKIRSVKREPTFDFDIARYAKAGPAACLQQHLDTVASLEKFGELTDDLNPLTLTESRIGIVAAGITWNYLQEVTKAHLLNPCTLKLGVAHPLPKAKIRTLLTHVDTVVVLEELDPLVEEAVLALRGEIDHPVKVIGKLNGPLSIAGDYNVETVSSVLLPLFPDKVLGPVPADDLSQQAQALKVKRLVTFCAGCPHRATYYALNQALEKLGYRKSDIIITGDIGCTILGMNDPFQSCWTEICMGSSISLAQGFKYAGIEKPVIATIGDGTFLHAGIPALINAAHNRCNITVIILDNHWASMTGMQPHAGTEIFSSAQSKQLIKAEEIVRAAGVHRIWRVNPYQTKKMIPTLMEAISSPEISVVFSDAECAIQKKRRVKGGGYLKVKPEKCVGLDACEHNCIKLLGCSALERGDEAKAFINPHACNACGLCHHVCPQGAI